MPAPMQDAAFMDGRRKAGHDVALADRLPRGERRL